jgi:cellulose synthase operon protein C
MDYPEAKKELERTLQLNPSLPTANSAYGRALLGLADLSGAEASFRKELSININDFEANLALGNLRKNASQFDEARAYLTRAVTMRPMDQTARKLLASLLLQTGDAAGAAGMFEALVKDVPTLVEAHVQLATAYNRLNRKADADRERAIVERLNAEIQAKQPGAAAGAEAQAPAAPAPAGGPQ